MVQIIAGRKGKGKTKHLLDMANDSIKKAIGSIVYLDKSSKHMYELNNRIRLINVNEFPITTSQGFVGFISGIISQDHDIETMFLDSFLKLACFKRFHGRWRDAGTGSERHRYFPVIHRIQDYIRNTTADRKTAGCFSLTLALFGYSFYNRQVQRYCSGGKTAWQRKRTRKLYAIAIQGILMWE